MEQFVIIPSKHLGLHLTGPVGNAATSASLGYTMSHDAYVGSNQLFNDVSYADRTSGKVYYRGLFFANLIGEETTETVSGEYTLRDVKIWVNQSSSGPNDEIYVGLDVIYGKRTGSVFSLFSLSTETSSLPGITWCGLGTTLSLGDYTTGSGIGVWVKRSVSAGGPAWKNSSASIMVSAEVVSGVQLV